MYYDINGSILTTQYALNGNSLEPEYSNEYQRNIIIARNEWMLEKTSGDDVISQIIHTDQHSRLRKENTAFDYLASVIPWNKTSAIIGLGDVASMASVLFDWMEECLDSLPREKRIDIWGNHDTWITENGVTRTPTINEYENILTSYFDNSNYQNHHRYNNYGIECMTDSVNHIKYVVIGGWEYDSNLGGYGHYVIGHDSMDAIIEMLSTVDDNDIVILSHIQPFKNQNYDYWTFPYEDTNGGGGLSSTFRASVGVVVNPSETSLDQMLIDRKNKASGTIKDSYGNVHSYDFTGCTSDLICCFAGHEHQNMYMHQNGNIPVSIFDAYAYDNHPFYFVNINRTKQKLSIWRVDETPQVVKYEIPFAV